MKNKLKRLLQFLALEDREKQNYLPKQFPLCMIYETSIETNNPLFCLAYECENHLERCWIQLDGRQLELIQDLRVVLAAMFELGTVYTSLWNLNEENGCILDELWRVLRRLARLALTEFGWDQTVPEVSFEKLFTTGKPMCKQSGSGLVLNFGNKGGFARWRHKD